jgi:hypothetical protein
VGGGRRVLRPLSRTEGPDLGGSFGRTRGHLAGVSGLTAIFNRRSQLDLVSTALSGDRYRLGKPPFIVTLEETSLAYTGDTHLADGTPAHLSAVLTEGGVTPISGRAVVLTLGSGATQQSCTGATNASGVALCTIASVNQPLNSGGTVAISATFNGDAFYQPSSATATALLQFLTGRAYGLSADVNLLLAQLHVPPQPDTGSVRTATALSTTTPCTVSLTTLLITAHSLCPNVTVTLAPGTSTGTSTVQDVTVGIPGLPGIKATAVKSLSTSTCTGSTGSVTIANLTVGGLAVNTGVGPNTGINLGGLAKLILNEQLPVPGADHGLTVNALHVLVADGTVNVVVASATSDAHNCRQEGSRPVVQHRFGAGPPACRSHPHRPTPGRTFSAPLLTT